MKLRETNQLLLFIGMLSFAVTSCGVEVYDVRAGSTAASRNTNSGNSDDATIDPTNSQKKSQLNWDGTVFGGTKELTIFAIE